jgi:hypothetical protein
MSVAAACWQRLPSGVREGGLAWRALRPDGWFGWIWWSAYQVPCTCSCSHVAVTVIRWLSEGRGEKDVKHVNLQARQGFVLEKAADSPPQSMPRPWSGVHSATACPSGAQLCVDGASDCIYPPHYTVLDRIMSRDDARLPQRRAPPTRLARCLVVEWSKRQKASMQASPKTGHKDVHALSPRLRCDIELATTHCCHRTQSKQTIVGSTITTSSIN